MRRCLQNGEFGHYPSVQTIGGPDEEPIVLVPDHVKQFSLSDLTDDFRIPARTGTDTRIGLTCPFPAVQRLKGLFRQHPVFQGEAGIHAVGQFHIMGDHQGGQ